MWTKIISHRLVEGKWRRGRPVFEHVLNKFKKGEGELFLLVANQWSGWSIRSSTTATEPFITNGRATNSPTSPQAEASVRFGWTEHGWAYSDGKGGWKEDDISVTCLWLSGVIWLDNKVPSSLLIFLYVQLKVWKIDRSQIADQIVIAFVSSVRRSSQHTYFPRLAMAIFFGVFMSCFFCTF